MASSSLYGPVASYPPSPRNAKGKGRATRDDDELTANHGDNDAQEGLSVGVRFTDGQTQDLVDLWVGARESVRDLKRRIRILRRDTLIARGDTGDDQSSADERAERPRRLRLILLGRVLPDGVFVVPFTNQLLVRSQPPSAQSNARSPDSDEEDDSQDEDDPLTVGRKSLGATGRGILGSVITSGVTFARGRTSVEEAKEDRVGELDALEMGKGKGKGKARAGLGGGRGKRRGGGAEPPTIWLHCSVGDPMDEDEIQAEADAAGTGTATASLPNQPQTTPLQGFDRLREAGFSEQDIENLRSEFRANAPPPSSDRDAAADEEHQRALEEQWMSGMTGLEEAAGGGTSGEGGHYYSLLKGVCAGFFVPFLPLFFFRTQIFSKRMQIAIVLGIVINLAFGFLRMLG